MRYMYFHTNFELLELIVDNVNIWISFFIFCRQKSTMIIEVNIVDIKIWANHITRFTYSTSPMRTIHRLLSHFGEYILNLKPNILIYTA